MIDVTGSLQIKNKIYQARLLVLFIAMSLSYLVVNFLIDLFMYSSFL